jgi:hypothetical protein
LPNNFIGPSLSELALIGPVAYLAHSAPVGDPSSIPSVNDRTAFAPNPRDVAVMDAVFIALAK